MSDAANIPYAQREPDDWTGSPLDVDGALDELASRTTDAETAIDARIKYGDIKGNGIIARSNTTEFQNRTITAGTGIAVTNGDGVSGNPTIASLIDGASYYAGSNSSTFTTSETDVPFDTANRTASFVSVSSGAFTVSADGVYMITASVNANQNGTSVLSAWYARLLVDTGSGYAETYPCRTSGVTDNAVNDWQSGSLSCIIPLDNGDTFKITGARASGSATFEWRGGNGYCHITILRIA